MFDPRFCPSGSKSSSDLKISLVDFSNLFLQTIFELRSCPPGSSSGLDLKISLANFSDLFLHKWKEKDPIPNMYKNRKIPKNQVLKFKIMLENFKSTQLNNKSIQLIYKSTRFEEYESNSAPRYDNLRLLIVRSIKFSTKN